MTLGRAAWFLPLLAGLVVSCGGDSSGPTAPTTSTTSRTPRVILQGSFTLDAPTPEGPYFGLVPITDSASGAWEATVDWTFPTNTLWMYVANGACSVEQFASADCPFGAACQCQFSVRSEVATPKPRVLSIANAAGGTRTLIVVNIGPREESGTYIVRLTPASSTSAIDGEGSGGQGDAAPRMVTARKALP